MVDREKIIEIIKKNGTYNGRSLSFDYYVIQPDELADALIAAGLVADVQSLANGDCVLYVKGKGFMRLYNEQDINETIHRAEVYEEMFDILHEESGMDMKVFSKEWYKQRAEKELAEEKKDD